MRFILSGGGTGGHVYPLAAVAEELLRRNGHELLWLGKDDALEERIAQTMGIPFQSIPAGRLVRTWKLENWTVPWRTLQGYFASKSILHTYQPHALISSAGYVSAPAMFAAHANGIRTILLESNAKPGITARMSSHLADIVVTAFPESARYFPSEKVRPFGNPVRKSAGCTSREESARYLGIDPAKKTVLFAGGSQGAHFISDLCQRLAPSLQAQGIQVMCWTGEGRSFPFPEGTIVKPFEEVVGRALGSVDFVVSRAGASWIAEILLAGIPSLLIPYPHAADNHQMKNAQALFREGAAYCLSQAGLREVDALDIIFSTLTDNEKYHRMKTNCNHLAKPNATKDIVDLILK